MDEKYITIKLTEEQYELLISELHSLSGYYFHANDCGSKIIDEIQSQARSQS